MATTSPASSFATRIATRDAVVGIVGLGYAGLPLGMSFAEQGLQVVGVDLNRERVDAVRSRRSYLVDVPEERYARVNGRFDATDDYAGLADVDAVVVCVPTPLSKTRTPDLTFIVSAVESLAASLRLEDQLVVLQSTTHPGTTEEIVLPILERGGRRVGRDFFLGYAPERIDPGNVRWNIRNTPKLVSGVTEECLRRTSQLFEAIVEEVVPLSSPMVAETAKLHENTFRAVNIALANELALMCDHLGVSAWEVIDAAASKPFGFLPHYPGPGLGGDCIPVVPHFLAWRLREYGYSAQLIATAHEINAHMPQYVVQKVSDALNEERKPINGSKLVLLGMAYKAGVHDTRESPSLEVMRLLLARGAEAVYCDPWVPELDLDGVHHTTVELSGDLLAEADCVVMLTPHAAFLEPALWERPRLVVDTRNVVPDGPHVRRI
jgi:UDP-N-acetyl-D-glucosamine dehydrogenase